MYKSIKPDEENVLHKENVSLSGHIIKVLKRGFSQNMDNSKVI